MKESRSVLQIVIISLICILSIGSCSSTKRSRITFGEGFRDNNVLITLKLRDIEGNSFDSVLIDTTVYTNPVKGIALVFEWKVPKNLEQIHFSINERKLVVYPPFKDKFNIWFEGRGIPLDTTKHAGFGIRVW